MVEYDVVFDATQQGFSFLIPALAPAAGAIVLVCLRFTGSVRRSGDRGAKQLRAMLVVGCVVLSGVTGFLELSLFKQYSAMRSALKDATYKSVVGQVTKVVSRGTDGHSSEQFQVGDVIFEYHEAQVTPAFHQTAPNGGPIREGLFVRIAVVDGAIARLEIANTRPN